MTPPCCICYTTDLSYLFPTFVSAVQARRHTAVDKADVAIFSFGAASEAERVFGYACQAEGIRFIPVPMDVIDGAKAMLARLFLTRFVPEDYEQFLYIDGDTQIIQSLDPIVEYAVPKERFLAISDPMTFELSGDPKRDRHIATYFSEIGIPPGMEKIYFNTGVLRINRCGWEELGGAAWRLFQKHEALSRFPDQDALNIVGGAQRIPMSLAWNFPIFMRNSRVERQISPRIYHFMGRPKPWHGVFQPWGADLYSPYGKLIAAYPDLAEFLSVLPPRSRLKYVLQQYYKKAFETVTWGLSPKRGRILRYEAGLPAPAMADLEPDDFR